MAGRCPPLPSISATGLPPLNKPRLAVVRFAKWSRVEGEQQKVFDAAIDKLRGEGAILEELELSELDDANWTAINCILSSEAALIFADLVANYPERTSDHLKSLVESGKAHSATGYLAARAFQDAWRHRLTSEMSGYDAVLTLPAFGEAPRGLHYTGDAEYCAPWTLLGVPAVTLPAGFGKHGLPLGLQIVGPYLNDHRMLRVAKWIEAALGFEPGIPTGLAS